MNIYYALFLVLGAMTGTGLYYLITDLAAYARNKHIQRKQAKQAKRPRRTAP